MTDDEDDNDDVRRSFWRSLVHITRFYAKKRHRSAEPGVGLLYSALDHTMTGSWSMLHTVQRTNKHRWTCD